MIMTRRDRFCLAIFSLNVVVQSLLAAAHFSQGSNLAWSFACSSMLFVVAIIATIRRIRTGSHMAR